MLRLRDILQIGRRFVAAMVLLVAATQAMAPFAQPLERQAGSAFSASTADVSLACGQPASITKRTVVAEPATPVLATPALPIVEPNLSICRPQLAGPGQTGPPPSRTSFSPLAPRAPPAA